jgi:hypothetical protein
LDKLKGGKCVRKRRRKRRDREYKGRVYTERKTVFISA